MKYIEFKDILKKKLCGIEENIDEEKSNKLYLFMNNLLEWNEKINLTAITDENEIILKHIVDSIYINKMLNGRVLDIGSGAGFPGIPLKIINDKIDIVSIDSVNKKINFQKDSIEKLGLVNIEAIHIRAEELAKNPEYRENFDFVVSRAVANMSTLVEYMIPFLKIGGKCICMKGPNSEEEIEKSKRAIGVLGGKIESIEKYKIDDLNERSLVIIEKIKHTSKEYPRGQGKPLKNPIV